ncbi:MAG: hypothetical protein Q9209_007846 [Squamulea sp. 1 TL-2023]
MTSHLQSSYGRRRKRTREENTAHARESRQRRREQDDTLRYDVPEYPTSKNPIFTHGLGEFRDHHHHRGSSQGGQNDRVISEQAQHQIDSRRNRRMQTSRLEEEPPNNKELGSRKTDNQRPIRHHEADGAIRQDVAKRADKVASANGVDRQAQSLTGNVPKMAELHTTSSPDRPPAEHGVYTPGGRTVMPPSVTPSLSGIEGTQKTASSPNPIGSTTGRESNQLKIDREIAVANWELAKNVVSRTEADLDEIRKAGEDVVKQAKANADRSFAILKAALSAQSSKDAPEVNDEKNHAKNDEAPTTDEENDQVDESSESSEESNADGKPDAREQFAVVNSVLQHGDYPRAIHELSQQRPIRSKDDWRRQRLKTRFFRYAVKGQATLAELEEDLKRRYPKKLASDDDFKG